MAEKRMFSRLIVENDKFKENALSSQCLYFIWDLREMMTALSEIEKYHAVSVNEDDMRVSLRKAL